MSILAQFGPEVEESDEQPETLPRISLYQDFDVYVDCGWKIDTAERLEDAQGAIWEALEQARQRAGEEFRGQEFEQRREVWLENLY
ncbi:hypothetical protein MAP00_005159 [Monascus purpureus]|nr:hypothetical protein MAP00_005159 [Monascus purpureus]